MTHNPARSSTGIVCLWLVFMAGGCGVGGVVRNDAGSQPDARSDCGALEVSCQGECVDPTSDSRYCGASSPCTGDTLGERCGLGDVCVNGLCVADCPGDQLECAGRCVDPFRDPEFCGASGACQGSAAGTACTSGMVCVSGACVPDCPTGQLACDGQCVDPSRDRDWCGAAGTCTGLEAGARCGSGEVCVAGLCQTSCPTGQLACQGRCIDPSTDSLFCGAVGSCLSGEEGAVCGPGEVCSGGVCRTSCPPGQVACGGRCVEPLSDPEFCGAEGDCAIGERGASCVAGEVCSSGVCAPNCPAGQLSCAGQCVDGLSDNTYCGASGDCAGANRGVVCDSGRVCIDGACEVRCVAGQVVCDDTCVDPLTSRSFCGASDDCAGPNRGVACDAGEVCAFGACAVSCVVGQLVCDGRCIDPRSDRTYCGAQGDCSGSNAGTPCGTGEICEDRSCVLTCGSGQVNCDGRCIDPLTDRTYCGASSNCAGPNSGVACPAGEICSAGACLLNCAADQVLCDGRCVNPMTDRVYCGASGDCMGLNAGAPCASGEVCSGGACDLTCGGSLTECGDQCVDTQTNPGFCGDCGTVCPTPANAEPVCIASSCDALCLDGFVDCNRDLALDGCEADLESDTQNCGSCGLACATDTHARAVCESRSCGLACDAGFLDCNKDLGRGGDGCETQAAACPLSRWVLPFGGTLDDRVIKDIASDGDGNVYVLGQYHTSIPFGGTTLSSGRFGAYLAKVDDTGTLRWVRNIASSVQDAFADRVVVDGDGNVLVAGYWFRGDLTVAGTTVGTSGSERGFAAKLTTGGTVLWARPMLNGRIRGAALSGSKLVVAGQFNATEMLDTVLLTHSGTTADGYVATLVGATGTVETAFAFGGDAADEVPFGIAVAPTGRLAIAGHYRLGNAAVGTQMLAAGGQDDGFVALFSATGTLFWAEALNTSTNENLWDVKVDASSHVYVSGHDGAGAYLARHSGVDGTRDWMVAMTGGNSFLGAERIALDDELVRGVFQFLGSGSVGGVPVTAALNAGASLAVARDTGAVTSALALAFENPVRFHAIADHPSGGVVVGASFLGGVTVDGVSVPHVGSWDDLVLSLFPL